MASGTKKLHRPHHHKPTQPQQQEQQQQQQVVPPPPILHPDSMKGRLQQMQLQQPHLFQPPPINSGPPPSHPPPSYASLFPFPPQLPQQQQQQQNEVKKEPSLNEKKAKFLALLDEGNVSAFAMWDAEKAKFESSAEFQALTSKQRKSTFEEYQQKKAENEKNQTLDKSSKVKDDFFDMMKQGKVDMKTTWISFRTKFKHKREFKAVPKEKERESLFRKYLETLKEEKKIDRKQAETMRETAYKLFDKLGVRTRHTFSNFERDILHEKSLKKSSRHKLKEYFKDYQKKYGETGYSAEKLRQRSVRREKILTDNYSSKANSHLVKKGAVDAFNTLLANYIRDSHMDFDAAVEVLQKKPSYSACDSLSEDEKRELFEERKSELLSRVRNEFRELVDEFIDDDDVELEDIQPLVEGDARFFALSKDEAVLARELKEYIVERKEKMIADFKDLLKETRCITHKSWSKVSAAENMLECPHMKEIQQVLENDKRYLVLEYDSASRATILVEYMRQLERDGTPPPPTTSAREQLLEERRRKAPDFVPISHETE
eukprot:m.53076 g.53076  ORF g.53076 m.53076 type:complete len:546 (+) comp7652_c0_seq1:2343-3980(+)